MPFGRARDWYFSAWALLWPLYTTLWLRLIQLSGYVLVDLWVSRFHQQNQNSCPKEHPLLQWHWHTAVTGVGSLHHHSTELFYDCVYHKHSQVHCLWSYLTLVPVLQISKPCRYIYMGMIVASTTYIILQSHHTENAVDNGRLVGSEAFLQGVEYAISEL